MWNYDILNTMNLKSLAIVFLIVSHSILAQDDLSPQYTEKSVYKIGFFASPPLSSIGEDNNPEGFIVDLLNEISKQEKFKIQWVFDDWSNLIELFKRNEIDMMTSVGYTEERSVFMKYSHNSFITVWGQVFLPSHSKIESIFDLENKSIGILRGGVNGQRFISQCAQFEINCKIIQFDSYEEIFKMVASGDIDAGVSNNLVGSTYLSQYDLINSAIVFNPFKVSVTSPINSSPFLLDKFDKYLSLWKDDLQSFYYTKRYKWLKPKIENKVPNVIMYLIIGLLVFAIVAIVFVFFLKKQVNKRLNELTKSELQLKQIINLVPHMIYVTDGKGDILLANKTASKYFGMSVEEFEKSNILEISKEYKRFKKLVNDDYDETGDTKANIEISARDSQGSRHTLYLSKKPYIGSNNFEESTVTVAVDITDIKDFEEKIKFMDQHDSLTQLPNRILLKDRINHSLALAKMHHHNGAILFIGIDHFKNINDSQGHKIGDLIIKEVAKRLEKHARIGDTVARLGGDEFIVELSELDKDEDKALLQSQALSQSILNILSQAYTINKELFHMTASIGVVVYPKDGENQEILLQRADTAMHKAKDNGRNRIQYFEKQLEFKAINKHRLEKDLRIAISENQFYLSLQPVLHGINNEVVGSEALIRWNHPSKGIIYPDDFIEVAEYKNFIVDIGDWVLETVCQQIQQWINGGMKKFFIAANVSVKQIQDEFFYEKIKTLVQKYKIPPNYLEIEVTESVLMEETERTIAIFKKLKLLGIKISLDDFGTGYASFNYLMNFPLDKIKIDQSFVKKLPDNPNSITIVSTILRMSQEMGMDVVAEGIENKQQYNFLKSKSCQYYQGYYFHKPLTIENMQKLI